MEKRNTGLIILDGWGIGDGSDSDAVSQARTPFFDRLMQEFPHATLTTFGEKVGLPEGQMGNSEVGHLNIGAGRIVYQDLVRINRALADGSMAKNPVLKSVVTHAEAHSKPIHLMGLVSRGGVHSSQEHLHGLVEILENLTDGPIYIHAFTDGRDTDPRNAVHCIGDLVNFLEGRRTRLASMIGRYYAMDRDKRWERTAKAYDLLVSGKGERVKHFPDAVKAQYAREITDEFFEPFIAAEDYRPISEGDAVICFNFRTDRCRQITRVLTQQDMPEHGMHTLSLKYVTMTRYDKTFRGVDVMFEKDNLKETLGEVVAAHNLTQLRVAETEKYPHVTFFFSGGREEPFEGESRLMVHSPKVATYDLQPEMSAAEVADKTVEKLRTDTPDFLCLNFANPDMVGHTGVFDAIVKAVETTDACLKQVIEAGREEGYDFVVIADHGNADKTRQENGKPHTAHTLNPVPVIVVSDRVKQVRDGILADVAPTCLQLLTLEQPPAMTGSSLIAD